MGLLGIGKIFFFLEKKVRKGRYKFSALGPNSEDRYASLFSNSGLHFPKVLLPTASKIYLWVLVSFVKSYFS